MATAKEAARFLSLRSDHSPPLPPFHAMLQHRQHKKLLAERRRAGAQAAGSFEMRASFFPTGGGQKKNGGWRPLVCVSLATKHPSWQTAEALLRLKAFNNRLDEEKGDLLYVARCRREGETMTPQ